MYRKNIAGILLIAWLALANLAWAIEDSLKVGKAPPDFALKSSAGNNLRLSEFTNQVVLINFWATWCGPCRKELPLLNALHERYTRAGFTVIGINIDQDIDKARAMTNTLGIKFPILFDPDNAVSKSWGLSAMPTTVIIDRRGVIRRVFLGYQPGYEKTYETDIRDLLKQ